MVNSLVKTALPSFLSLFRLPLFLSFSPFVLLYTLHLYDYHYQCISLASPSPFLSLFVLPPIFRLVSSLSPFLIFPSPSHLNFLYPSPPFHFSFVLPYTYSVFTTTPFVFHPPSLVSHLPSTSLLPIFLCLLLVILEKSVLGN